MDLVTAATVTSRAEAELVRARLESAGIDASVHSDDAGGQYPNLSQSGVRILVREEDLEEAEAVLAEPPERAPE